MKAYEDLTEIGRWRRLAGVARLAAAAFPGLQPDSVRLLQGGWNTMFRVEDDRGARYALRVSRPGLDAAQIASEIAWLEVLAEGPVRVVRPVRARDGRAVVTVSLPGVTHARHCTVSAWLPGRQYGERPTPRMLHAVGAATARLHAHAAGWAPPADFCRPRLDSMWWGDAPDFSDFPGTAQEILARTAESLAPVLDGVFRHPLHVIHGDLHQWNYRFLPGLEVALLDFDDCGIGHPIQDLAITQFYLLPKENAAALRAAHRAGYETVAPWPEPFEGALEALVAHRSLTLASAIVGESDADLLAQIPRFAERLEARLGRWQATGSCFPRSSPGRLG